MKTKVVWFLEKAKSKIEREGLIPACDHEMCIVINRLLLLIFRHLKIQKYYIVLRSEGDFTDNTRAFYDYLLSNGYNRKYRLIWLVRDPEKWPQSENVKFVSYDHPRVRLKEAYYIGVSKFIIFSHGFGLNKWRKEQVVIYTTHSVDGLKAYANWRKKTSRVLKKEADYTLCCSERVVKKLQKYFPDSTMLLIGMPRIDLLFRHKDCLKTIFPDSEGKKFILVMETFKQHSESWIDGETPNKYAINVVKDIEQLIRLDEFLGDNNCKMAIKIHHLQDLSFLEMIDHKFENIRYLTDDILIGEYDIQVNELLENADLLITDYSSVFYEFLLLDRPIGFTIGDIDSYSRGFEMENILKEMPGKKIKCFDELIEFLASYLKGEDKFADERKAIKETRFKYVDDKNSERLIKWIEDH